MTKKKRISEKQFLARLRKKLSQIDISLVEKDEGSCETISIQGNEIAIKWKPRFSELDADCQEIIYNDCASHGRELIEKLRKNNSSKEEN